MLVKWHVRSAPCTLPRNKIFTCTDLIKSYALNKYASSLKVYIIQFTDPDQAIWAQKIVGMTIDNINLIVHTYYVPIVYDVEVT